MLFIAVRGVERAHTIVRVGWKLFESSCSRKREWLARRDLLAVKRRKSQVKRGWEEWKWFCGRHRGREERVRSLERMVTIVNRHKKKVGFKRWVERVKDSLVEGEKRETGKAVAVSLFEKFLYVSERVKIDVKGAFDQWIGSVRMERILDKKEQEKNAGELSEGSTCEEETAKAAL